MNMMTRQSLNGLLENTGHSLTLDDYDLIKRLDACATKVVDPAAEENESLLSAPVWVSGVPVYPLSVGLAMWLDEIILPWFDGDPHYQTLSMVYVLTLEDPFPVLESFGSARDAKKAIRKWWFRCPWRQEQIERVTELRYPKGDAVEAESNYGAVLALLCREYGNSPQYWMAQPIGMTSAMLSDFTARQESEAASNRKAAAKGGKALAPPPSPKLRALKQYRSIETEIEATWQKT